MFKDVLKITNLIAIGAGYAIVILVLAAVIDSLFGTNLARFFGTVGLRGQLGFAAIYCLALAVMISTHSREPHSLEAKLNIIAVDRLLSFLGVCIAIAGIPAYTRHNPIPLYVAVFVCALASCAFAIAMFAQSKIGEGRNEFIKHAMSFFFLVASCGLAIAAVVGPQM